jgi:hypothetical protein
MGEIVVSKSSEGRSLYDVLAEPALVQTDPDTVETRQIETIDADQARLLLQGSGLS